MASGVELFGSSLKTDANLIFYWRFEGNSNTTTGSNNGTDTAITYGAGTGKFGQGAAFNGTTSKIAISSGNYFGTNLFTINAWIKTSTSGATQELCNLVVSSNPGVSCGIYTDNKPFFYIHNGTTSKLITGGTGATITNGAWHMITFVKYATNDWKIYTDGIQTNADTTSLTGTLDNAGTKFIGCAGASEFLNGSIDDLSMFTKALTTSEISQLYYDSPRNGNWSLSREIRADNTKVSGASDLTSFPAYIKDTNIPSAIYSTLQSAGQDLRITSDSAGTTEVPFEIVSITPASNLCEIWVKVPTLLTASDTFLYLWSGNANAIAIDANATYGSQNVWTGYKGVHHLQTLTADSTVNANTLTNNNTVGSATTKIGSGADYGTANTNKFMSRASNYAINGGGDYMLSAWVKLRTEIAAGVYMFVEFVTQSGTNRYLTINYSYNAGTRRIGADASNGIAWYNTSLGTTDWHYVQSIRTSAGTAYLYVDGVQRNTAAIGTVPYAKDYITIGSGEAGANPVSAYMDEVRIAQIAPTADWIATEYANQNDPATFWYEVPTSNYLKYPRRDRFPGTINAL